MFSRPTGEEVEPLVWSSAFPVSKKSLILWLSRFSPITRRAPRRSWILLGSSSHYNMGQYKRSRMSYNAYPQIEETNQQIIVDSRWIFNPKSRVSFIDIGRHIVDGSPFLNV